MTPEHGDATIRREQSRVINLATRSTGATGLVLVAALVAGLGAACTAFSGWGDLNSGGEDPIDPDAATIEGGPRDASTTPDADAAARASCAWDAPFTSARALAGPVNLAGARSSYPTLTQDERTLYFQRATDAGILAIVRAERTSTDLPFDGVAFVGDTSNTLANPSLSADGQQLAYVVATNGFYSLRVAPVIGGNIDFSSARPFATDPSAPSYRFAPNFASDGTLWFTEVSTSGDSVWQGRVLADGGVEATLVQTNARTSLVSRDGLTLYIVRGGVLQRGHRGTTAIAFGSFAPVPELAVPGRLTSLASWFSPDECRLYFGAGTQDDAAAPTDLFMAERKLSP